MSKHKKHADDMFFGLPSEALFILLALGMALLAARMIFVV